MSMMDTMGTPPAQPQQPDPSQQPPQAGGPQGVPSPEQGTYGRLGEGGDYQKQTDKVMMLLSSELWENGLSSKVNEQMTQDESDPSAIVGKFTSFLLLGTQAAFRSKQQMPEPIVMVDCARQIADQMTDIGLANKTVSPNDADDTAEAGTLIGLGLFLQQAGSAMQPDEKAEYQNIITQIIQNSPDAAKLAQENADDATQVDTGEGDDNLYAPDGEGAPVPPQQPGAMASTMGAA